MRKCIIQTNFLRRLKMDENYELAVIGGGPGGYVAALRGAQLKKKVVLFEKEKLGGTCMNWGCIPTKYLLHQTKMYEETKKNKNLKGPINDVSFDWKRIQEEKNKIVARFIKGIEFLLKKNGVKIVRGHASLTGEKQVKVRSGTEQEIFEADRIILATGSKPAELPSLQSNGKNIFTSREALELKGVPQSLIVVGAGAIGLEMGLIFQRLGCQVIVLEVMPNILPGSDKEMVTRLERLLKLRGLKIFTHMDIQNVSFKGNTVTVQGECKKDQKPFSFSSPKVLLAVGRRPNSEKLGELDSSFLDKKGFVQVKPNMETKIPGVYAIGDLIGGKLLAHKASHEGILAAENAAGLGREIDYKALPMAVYTEPEFSSVGLTQEEAEERRMTVQTGVFSLQANGRALTLGKPDGLVKIIADKEDRVVGAHILAPNASELLTEVTMCVEKKMRLQDISCLWHIHPTLSEAVMEAALMAKGEALHVLNK
jgi:dihydrolipoamide dehydrogenase